MIFIFKQHIQMILIDIITKYRYIRFLQYIFLNTESDDL